MLTKLLEAIVDLWVDSRTISNISTGGTAPSEANTSWEGNNLMPYTIVSHTQETTERVQIRD